jgi:hypothetical protein
VGAARRGPKASADETQGGLLNALSP